MAGLMSMDIETLRAAFEARASGTLEEFLQDYPDDEKDEIRTRVTPGVAFRSNNLSIITKNTASEDDIPSDDGGTWKRHKDWISNGPYSLPGQAVASITESTREICTAINSSKDDRIYGLVVGYVQSGKTANYTALLSRAVDMGYTFVVILSGILNDLRRQTQVRLMRDLVGDPHGDLGNEFQCINTEGTKGIRLLTSPSNDVGVHAAENLPDLLDEQHKNGGLILAVMKKNVLVLEHLLDGIKRTGADKLSRHKILIIDDEADHATVNTGGGGSDDFADPSLAGDEEEEEYLKEANPTRTNKRIRQILKRFDKSTYIGYTATPFANVLINKNQEDRKYGKSLYPRDFIIALPCPRGYFGAEEFFGGLQNSEEASKHTVLVPEEEVDRAFNMEQDVDATREDLIPLSLKTAMMDFILTGLAKRIRMRNGVKLNRHHTMLIHVQWKNDDQSNTTAAVDGLFEDWKQLAETTLIGRDVTEFRRALRDRWESEYRSANPSIETWTEIEEELSVPEDEGGWMSSVKVRMINSLNSDERLDYENHPKGLNVIAIGGNKLSRGLTLEGLTTSYFLRRTKMYDSLMQMGRWFGFRAGYEDLVRVHSSLELLTWFEWLVTVENSVRSDIARYEILGMTPEQLAVRVPLHPVMRITASSKMKNAITSIQDYQGTTVQTIRLPVEDESRLLRNLECTTDFLESLEGGSQVGTRMWAWRGVSSSEVADYLEKMDFIGPPHAVFDSVGIARYLNRKHGQDKVFVAHAGGDVMKLPQAPSKVPANDPSWSFGTRYIARSQGFEIVNGQKRGTNNLKVISDRNDIQLATQLDSGICMLVYLIAPGSVPRNEKRIALPNHETPIVGIAIRFPPTDFEDQIRAYAHTRGVAGDV